MTRTNMYYNNNRLLTTGPYNGVLEVGDKISPFNTKNGRVLWEVTYIEDIDPETFHVHIKDYGFLKEEEE